MSGFSKHIFQNIFIDIETVPQNRDFLSLNEKWRALFIEKNAKVIPEDTDMNEVYHSRAGILAEFGKIICISIGYLFKGENEPPKLKIKSLHGHDERAILSEFMEIISLFNKRFPDFI